MGQPAPLATPGRPRPSWRLLAPMFLAASLLAACESSTSVAGAGHVEAWQADVAARFTFPPVGLEEFALARRQSGSAEIVIHIAADGALEQIGAERVEGFDEEALETLFAAIRHARFAPAIVNGHPVASIKRIAFDIDPLAGRFITTAQDTAGAH